MEIKSTLEITGIVIGIIVSAGTIIGWIIFGIRKIVVYIKGKKKKVNPPVVIEVCPKPKSKWSAIFGKNG